MRRVQCASAKFQFSCIMNFNIENDRSTDADVGWYVNNLAFNGREISGRLISRMVFA